MKPPTLEEAIAEVLRELAMRKSCYPRWVESGKLKPETAERQLTRLQLALANLRDIEGAR